MQNHALPCKTMYYHAIPYIARSTMQYPAKAGLLHKSRLITPQLIIPPRLISREPRRRPPTGHDDSDGNDGDGDGDGDDGDGDDDNDYGDCDDGDGDLGNDGDGDGDDGDGDDGNDYGDCDTEKSSRVIKI